MRKLQWIVLLASSPLFADSEFNLSGLLGAAVAFHDVSPKANVSQRTVHGSVGVGLGYALTENLGVEVNLLSVKRYFRTALTASDDVSFSLSTAQLPLLARYQLMSWFSLAAGPWIGFVSKTAMTWKNDNEDQATETQLDINTTELGILVAGRILFPIFDRLSVFFEPRYNFSLTQLAKTGSLKLPFLSVLAGASLRI